MSDLDALYRELILDHSKHPQHFGLAAEEGAHATSHQKNPVCGDEITLRARDHDRWRQPSATSRGKGSGCSISQASASMLSDLVEGSVADRGGSAHRRIP